MQKYFFFFMFSQNNSTLLELTHWGRVTHICVSDLTSIGSDNGLSPGRRQAIIRTNAGILLIRPLGTNFSDFFSRNSNIFIQEKAFESVVCEKAAILSRPQWINSSSPSAAYIHQWAESALVQCWLTVSWTLGNIFYWSSNWNSIIFIKKKNAC